MPEIEDSYAVAYDALSVARRRVAHGASIRCVIASLSVAAASLGRRTRLAAALAAVAAAGFASGQETVSPSPSPSPGFEERVAVQLVQLNVVATDRKGGPVRDLTPADLEITEGGAPRRIAFVRPYYAPAEPGAVSPVPEPPPAEGAAPGRWIVLLVDAYASRQGTKLLALEAAQDFVDHDLSPADRVAVAAFTGKIDFVQSFTGDAAKLKVAVERLSGSLERAVEDRFGAIQSLADEVAQCRGTASPTLCAQRLVGPYDDARVREADAYLVALTELTRALGPIPYVKSVVLVSDGFARNPASDAVDVTRSVLGLSATMGLDATGDEGVRRQFDELAAAAAKARVSFFTINPGGAARAGATSARSGSPAGGAAASDPIDVFERSDRNYQEGLAELARRTGGTASVNPDVRGAVKHVADLSAGLYTVAYYLGDDAGAFSTRDVRIKSKRRGVRIETRREVPKLADPRPLLGELTVKPDPCSERGRRIAVVRLRLDRSRLQFVRVGKDLSSNFALYVRALADGGASPTYDDYRFLNVTHSQDEMAKGNIPDPAIEETLLVPCSGLTVVVDAMDAESGASAQFTARIEP